MKNIKLYNVFFPIWFLLLFPVTWIIAMPVNFVIDSIVILLSLKFLKIDDIYQKYKKVILKVFLFGFFSDFVGAIFLFLMSTLVGMGGEESGFFKWINNNIIDTIMRNPFSFKNVDMEEKDKKKLALYMAIFTAPYFFFVPTSVIYNLPT